MFKTFIYIFALLLSLFSFALAKSDRIYCDAQLKPLFANIQKIPEAKKLIESIQKEGPIQIRAASTPLSQQFGACWDCGKRIIYVNASQSRSKGALIGSILFELHNAAVNSKMNEYDKLAATGKMSQEAYVRAIEYLEYQNSLMTAKMAEEGIRLGLIPRESRLPTYPNFEEHYRMQKIGGHSAWIAMNFQSLAPRVNKNRERIEIGS